MALSESFIAELEQEAGATRRVLERIPEDKLAWRPHPRSFSLGQLALHVATIPGNVSQLAMQSMTAVPEFVQAEAESRAEVLDAHEASVEAGKAALASWTDPDLMEQWTLSVNGDVKMAMPRVGLLRAIMFNHLYHHRGQLLVYLRLLEVPVPAVYGVSADENPLA